MKAVGYRETGSTDRADALIDFEADKPTPKGHDLLVKVQAVSVNPVDTKIRQKRAPVGPAPDILGWDAVGIVEAVGETVETFSPGDTVGTPGRSTDREPMPSFIWWMNVLSGQRQIPYLQKQLRRCR
nr:alcohol dehydrogenase catalytic domain-containing protein [uncultured Ruegeria sp.]